MEPILKVRNLQTGYGDLRVVWDVSFDVYPGAGHRTARPQRRR